MLDEDESIGVKTMAYVDTEEGPSFTCSICKLKVFWNMAPCGGESTGETEPCERCGRYVHFKSHKAKDNAEA